MISFAVSVLRSNFLSGDCVINSKASFKSKFEFSQISIRSFPYGSSTSIPSYKSSKNLEIGSLN